MHDGTTATGAGGCMAMKQEPVQPEAAISTKRLAWFRWMLFSISSVEYGAERCRADCPFLNGTGGAVGLDAAL